jgi:carbonic anhydrase/acetyltransferase-like protein (isoleucine patch superfamily)
MPAEPGPDGVFVAASARVRGDVRLGGRANVWFGSLVDGTEGPVELDEAANVQDNCEVRGVAGQRTYLGHRAAMGHNARLLGGVVEERVLIAIGATVLPGAHVGTLSIVAANATVPEGMTVPPHSLIIGHGRIVRQVTDVEIARIERTGNEYLRLASEYLAQHGEPARLKGSSL